MAAGRVAAGEMVTHVAPEIGGDFCRLRFEPAGVPWRAPRVQPQPHDALVAHHGRVHPARLADDDGVRPVALEQVPGTG